MSSIRDSAKFLYDDKKEIAEGFTKRTNRSCQKNFAIKKLKFCTLKLLYTIKAKLIKIHIEILTNYLEKPM